MNRHNRLGLNRRDLLKWGGAALLGSAANLRPSAAYAQIKACPTPDPLEILQGACVGGPTSSPPSSTFGFNGTFPGPMIYGRYGRPVVVRFENQLDQNPHNHDAGDFGSPRRQFLTHLHNGHTAPESDGNPHFRIAGYH